MDAVIVAISDDVLTNAVDGHTCQTVELSLALTVRTEALKEPSLSVENLKSTRDSY